MCVLACTRGSEAGYWPISNRRRQDSVSMQMVGEEGAGGVAVRNRNGGENPVLLAFYLHADDTLYHYMEGRCSY